MPRFSAKLGPDELLDGAGMVLGVVDPECPDTVSERAFDAKRSLVSGMPTARVACQRLGLSWEQFKRIALTPAGPRRSRALGTATRRPRAKPTLDVVAWALRTAAQALGVLTLRPQEYAEFQQQAEARGARAWKHGRAHGPLPTLDQILVAVSWEEGLAAAGLDAGREPIIKRGKDPAALLRAFVEAFGGLPAESRQLIQWAKRSGVAMARFQPRWSVIRSDLIAEREEAGLPELPVCPAIWW